VRGNRSLRGASPTAKKRTRALRGKSPRGAR
jgi:hypothetical protein